MSMIQQGFSKKIQAVIRFEYP